MSKRHPEEILAVLEEQAAEDEARAIAKMSDADLDEELRRAGVDPEQALASAPAAPDAPAPAGRAPISANARNTSRVHGPRTRRSVAWTGVAVAAAGLAIVFALRQKDERHEETTAAHGRNSAHYASELRDQAFAACDRAEWALCQTMLDAAERLDPRGEDSARVVRARQAVQGALSRDASIPGE